MAQEVGKMVWVRLTLISVKVSIRSCFLLPTPLKSFYSCHLGSFFCGSPSTMAWWAHTFYAYHNYYIAKCFFLRKGQTVYSAILVLFNECIITLCVIDPKVPATDNPGNSNTGLQYGKIGFGVWRRNFRGHPCFGESCHTSRRLVGGI